MGSIVIRGVGYLNKACDTDRMLLACRHRFPFCPAFGIIRPLQCFADALSDLLD